jgi:curved DNA-binding protein CbpA
MYSHYDTLGITISATDSEIRAAYKARLLEVHPDKQSAIGERVQLNSLPRDLDVQKVQEAFEVLKDPARRAQHNAALRASALKERFVGIPWMTIAIDEMTEREQEDGVVYEFECRCGDFFVLPVGQLVGGREEVQLQCNTCTSVLCVLDATDDVPK